MTTVIDSPDNDMLRIDTVWMFVSVDATGEGVCAAPLMGQGTLIPLIAADEARLESLMPWAQEVARLTGKTIKLIKFTARSDELEIAPNGRRQ